MVLTLKQDNFTPPQRVLVRIMLNLKTAKYVHFLGIILLIGVIVYTTVIGRSFTALTPDESDARLFAYIGSQWVEGKIPYVDIWDNKPPGIFVLTALISSHFSNVFLALSVLEGIFIVGCIVTIYFLMRQFGAPRSVVVLTTIVATVACNLAYYNECGGRTEIYIIWPAAMSMLFFVFGIHNFRQAWLLFSGFCTGIALMFKTIGLSLFLAQFAFFLWSCLVLRCCSFRFAAFSILSISIGLIFVWLIPITYFSLHGGLIELLDASFFYNFVYGAYSQPSLFAIPLKLAYKLRYLVVLVLCVFIVTAYLGNDIFHAIRGIRSARARITSNYSLNAVLVLLWFFFDLVASMAGGRYYPHYFLAVIPSLTVLSGFSYWLIIDNEFTVFSKTIRALIVAIIICPLLFYQIGDTVMLINKLKGRHHIKYKRAITFLNDHLKKGDTLFTWGYMPSFYFDTGLQNSTRLLSAHYLFDSPYARKRFENELLYTLERSRPTFIVIRKHPYIGKFASENNVYRKFRKLIMKSYFLIYNETNVGGIQIFKVYPEIAYFLYRYPFT